MANSNGAVAMSLDEAKILVMQGQKGDPGVSPTVAVDSISGGHRVTITDKDGDHTFDVMDGDGVFEIPVTVDTTTSPTTYSTTVSAAEILAHRKNLVMTMGPGVLLTYDGFGTSVPDLGVFYFSARHFDNNVEYVVSAKIDVNNIDNANIVTITRRDYHFAVTPN